MKKIILLLVISLLITGVSNSQYKPIPEKTKLKTKSGGLILGFINPKNFSLNHSFNMSFLTGGNTSVSLASYTATLNYKILDNMNISAEVTMQYSPYASISSGSSSINKEFQNSFNGINLSRVSLDYQPAKNMHISLNYFNNKNNLYWYDNYYYNNYYDRIFWENR
jgi:hypothetical protein